MKRWKKILGVTLLIVMVGIGYGLYLYTKKPPDTRKMTADAELSAHQLVSDFTKDEAASNKKYIDKILIVTGKVAAIEKNKEAQAIVSLESNNPLCAVVCSFYSDEIPTLGPVKPGSIVKIKGNCTGILSDVILNKCSIIP